MSKYILCLSCLLVVSLSMNGCVAMGVGAAAAAGGVEYAEGASEATVDASIERVYNASLAVLESEELPIKHKALGSAKADINSEFLGGDEIRIDMKSEGKNSTKLSVRVGLVGNSSQESTLLQKIQKRV